ncbi:PBS lyase [Telmatospirillum siberiense]|uniref:PBS lyase n=1 Tax=Telmatospirillum siberiense TaxID=382514 RepID=A0A2N3Q238_9PROT|nr:PBS lyase [Telmatospirillum siberiense]
MLADLSAAEPSVRRAAARDLAPHPEAAMALCDRLEVEASPSVRAVLLTSLIHLQSPTVAMRLASLLRSDDVPLRNAAIEALQEMPDAVAPHLRDLLADEDSDVRIFAVNILGALRHGQAPQWLTDVVRSDPHINVCAAAVDGLAEIGGPETLIDLEALRRRYEGNPFMEFAIDAAMRRIRGH